MPKDMFAERGRGLANGFYPVGQELQVRDTVWHFIVELAADPALADGEKW